MPEHTLFRLYISAASPISARAVVNARRFLECHFPGCHRLEVINIADHVAQARADQIIAAPTLVQVLGPTQLRRFIGDMSNAERLRKAMGLRASPPQP